MPADTLDTWSIETETTAGAPVTVAYTSGGVEAAPADIMDLINRRVTQGSWVALAPEGPAAPPTTTGPGWAVLATVFDAIAPICNLANVEVLGDLPEPPDNPDPVDLYG